MAIDQSTPLDLTTPPDLTTLPDLTCTDPTACNGKCGMLTNKCGVSVTCGGCSPSQSCLSNVCCTSDATACTNANAQCGTITVNDNCGMRTANCAACGASLPACVGNKCVECASNSDCKSGLAPFCTPTHQCSCGFMGNGNLVVVCPSTQLCNSFDTLGNCGLAPGETCPGVATCASFACDGTSMCTTVQSGAPCVDGVQCLSRTCVVDVCK
jgi:hypothetical protein